MDVDNIGKFLLKLRKENNLTQKEIAKLCNLSAQAVSKWERGESIPDIEILERLSILYKISINEIINGEKKELYLDLEKRKHIIYFTASILVFSAYLFNFAHGNSDFGHYFSFDIEFILKGYQLIFDGVGGVFVYLSWIVFVILISHLIIRIYLITKIINESKIIKRYLTLSMVIVILLSIISIFIPVFYIFPQFIIILAMVIQLSGENHLETFREFRKKNIKFNETGDLTFHKEIDYSIIKISKFAMITGIAIYYLLALVFLITTVTSFIKYQSDFFNVSPYVLFMSLTFLVGSLLVYLYKYIGSIHFKKILIISGILTLLLPMFLVYGGIVDLPKGYWMIIYFSILLVTSSVPISLLYSSYKL